MLQELCLTDKKRFPKNLNIETLEAFLTQEFTVTLDSDTGTVKYDLAQ